MEFKDIFTAEYFSSKFSRLLPYALSFMIPYGGGAMLGARLMGRFGPLALKALSKTKVLGQMGKGIKGTKAFKGTGLMGKVGYDAGKKGIKATQLAKTGAGYIGGGIAANLAEGAYLSGEAYNQLLQETDAQGNPLFTPDEAADHAKGVMWDNGAWAAVDILSYGLLFGGLGKVLGGAGMLKNVKPGKLKFSEGIGGLTRSLVKKVAPALPTMGAYATFEGITEGFQEVYQEWAKYAEIQEAKRLDYEHWSDWLLSLIHI